MGFRILHPKSGPDGTLHDRCALAIMAKAPQAGRVKTRLSPPLSATEAAALSICFLRDTAENIDAVSRMGAARGVVSYTPVGAEALFEGILPEGFALLAQRGEDFGQRLLHTAEDLFACGFASVCLIDADSPTVPAEVYEEAVRDLGRAGERIVLGPAADGGYYLIGLKSAQPELFEGVRWSTDAVYGDTLQRAQRLGVEVVELPLWYDVDNAATLNVLRAELLAGIAPGFALTRGYAAPHTRKLLSELDPAVNAGKGLAVEAGGAADAAVDYRELPPASNSGEAV